MMLSKGLNKKVVLGVVCGLSLPVAVNASDFIYAKTDGSGVLFSWE